MACANLASILLVVLEVLIAHDAVLVADETVLADEVAVEGNLALGIVGNADELVTLVDEDLHHLVLAVDVVVGAIARIADFLHHGIVQVAHAEAEAGHVDAFAGVALHHFHQSVGTGDAHVEVAVGAQDDAVVALGVVVGQRLLVGHLQRFAAVGAAFGR